MAGILAYCCLWNQQKSKLDAKDEGEKAIVNCATTIIKCATENDKESHADSKKALEALSLDIHFLQLLKDKQLTEQRIMLHIYKKEACPDYIKLTALRGVQVLSEHRRQNPLPNRKIEL